MIEGEPPTLQSTDSPARQGDEDREPAGKLRLAELTSKRNASHIMAKKAHIENWRRIPCPHCGAGAGAHCYFEHGKYGLRHQERAEAANREFGQNIRGIAGRTTDQAVHKYITRRWSAACRRGHPEECSGFRRVPRSPRVPCECPVHRITE
jgi:hypothetical protein